MNDLVVNELSFRRFRERDQPCAAANRAEACIWMSTFVRTLAELASINPSRILRTLEEFSYQELAPDYSVVQWRNDRQVNRDERELFRLYTTKSPLLNDVLEQIVQRERGCEAKFEGIEAKGLLVAFLLDSLSVSLPSDPAWQTARLSVSILELDEGGDPILTDEIILHAASPECVRELAPLFEVRIRDHAASGRDIVEHKGMLLPKLRFCGNVEETLIGMGPNDPGFAWVRRSLLELNDHCRTWVEGEFRHSMLRGSPAPESQSVDDNDDLRRLRLFACADGKERYFRWHMKNKSLNLRLHYFPKNDEHIVLIGYIGPHLPTARY